MLASTVVWRPKARQQFRSHSITSGLLSRLSVKLTRRLTGVFRGNSPDTGTNNDCSPRASTAVAQAARQVAAKRSARELAHFETSQAAHASSTQKLVLSTSDARAAAFRGPAKLAEFFVQSGQLKPDAAQNIALQKLDALFEILGSDEADRCCGLYLHGPVGVGKTMLMDLFVASAKEALPKLRVCRIHLHEFMHGVHIELNRMRLFQCRGTQDQGNCDVQIPIPGVCEMSRSATSQNLFKVLPVRWWLLGEQSDQGRRRTGMAAAYVHTVRWGTTPTSVEKLGRALATKIDVLCFDEVAIGTIQDCVVLGPLLRSLCEHGVIIVATSNRSPDELYAGGLNRHIHLPQLVNAIQKYCRIHHMMAHKDHRKCIALDAQGSLPGVFLWHSAEGCEEGQAFLDEWWQRAVGTSCSHSTVLPVSIGYGRSMLVLQSPCRTCARFSFAELCAAPLSSDDFAALSRSFRVLFISDIPRMRGDQHVEAQRWIWLLDNCYEHHTQLVLTSVATSPEDLVDLRSVAAEGAGTGRSLQEVSFAVARTISRLHEMQTWKFFGSCSSSNIQL